MNRKSTKKSTVDFRLNFSEVMNQSSYGHLDQIITRRGKDIAVLISMDAYKEYLDLLERRDGE